MKKLMLTSAITLAVGLTLVLVAAVLNACTGITGFTVSSLTAPMNSIGYLVAALSGVLLTGCAIVDVVKGGDVKKLIVTSTIIVAVGVTLVLTAGILNALAGSINTTGFTVTNLTGAFNTVGYLIAVLAGVLLVASSVASVVKEDGKK